MPLINKQLKVLISRNIKQRRGGGEDGVGWGSQGSVLTDHQRVIEEILNNILNSKQVFSIKLILGCTKIFPIFIQHIVRNKHHKLCSSENCLQYSIFYHFIMRCYDDLNETFSFTIWISFIALSFLSSFLKTRSSALIGRLYLANSARASLRIFFRLISPFFLITVVMNSCQLKSLEFFSSSYVKENIVRDYNFHKHLYIER